MKYPNKDERARKASAVKAASNLVNLAVYQPVAEPALLPPSVWDCINVPAANLLLAPCGNWQARELLKAVREFRSTAVVIEPGMTNEGQPTFYMMLLHPQAGVIRRYASLRLWLDLDRNLFLVPYPQTEGTACFVMDELGVRSVGAPWKHEADYEFGLKHGDAVLLAP